MYYFDSKSDLTFINLFKDEVACFYAAYDAKFEHQRLVYFDESHEEKTLVIDKTVNELRVKIAKKLKKAIEISTKYGVNTAVISIPSQALGGTMIPVNMYEAILNDNSHGRKMTPQLIIDTINQTIGQIELQNRKDRVNVFNPFFWFKILFVKIIRIPFLILSVSGFNVEVIERHFISKIFKFVEGLLIVLLLFWCGLECSEIKSALLRIFLK